MLKVNHKWKKIAINQFNLIFIQQQQQKIQSIDWKQSQQKKPEMKTKTKNRMEEIFKASRKKIQFSKLFMEFQHFDFSFSYFFGEIKKNYTHVHVCIKISKDIDYFFTHFFYSIQ